MSAWSKAVKSRTRSINRSNGKERKQKKNRSIPGRKTVAKTRGKQKHKKKQTIGIQGREQILDLPRHPERDEFWDLEHSSSTERASEIDPHDTSVRAIDQIVVQVPISDTCGSSDEIRDRITITTPVSGAQTIE